MTDPRRALVERDLAAYNAIDIPAMLEVLHPEVVFRNVANGETTDSTDGLEQFRTLAERSATLFTSRRQTVTSWTDDGDEVTIGIDYEGVLAVDLSPELRAGDTLRLTGRSTFGFRDGRIASIVDEV